MTLINCSEFLEQYQAKNTKVTYSSILRGFFRISYPEMKDSELDNMSIKYLESKPDVRADLVKYRNSLDKKAPMTRLIFLTCVLRFLEDNEISLPKPFVRNLKGKGNDAISEEFVPDNSDLAKMCEYLPLIGKSMVLCLSSSGMRIGELLNIKIENLDLTKNPARISIPRDITKTKKARITFISSEAKQSVEEWLSYRSEWIRVQRERSIYPIEDDGRLFQISEESFIKLWRRAIDKAKLLKIDQTTKRMTLHPHSLRKFFRTRGGWTNPDIAEALMGHIGGLKGVYTRFDQAEKALIEGYLAAEPNLSISVNSKTITELRQKVTKQSDDITQLVTNLSLRNAKLENDLNQVKTDLIKIVDLVQMDAVETIKELSDRMGILEERDRKLSEIEDRARLEEALNDSSQWTPVVPTPNSVDGLFEIKNPRSS